MRLSMLDSEPRQEPMELSLADVYRIIGFGCWPFEAAFFQASIIEPEAVGIPEEDFDFIARAIAEDEPGLAQWIHLQHIGDDQRQSIN